VAAAGAAGATKLLVPNMDGNVCGDRCNWGCGSRAIAPELLPLESSDADGSGSGGGNVEDRGGEDRGGNAAKAPRREAASHASGDCAELLASSAG